MRKGKDPDPDPYLWIMDPDPDQGGPKHADPDPVPDIQHWLADWMRKADPAFSTLTQTPESNPPPPPPRSRLYNLDPDPTIITVMMWARKHIRSSVDQELIIWIRILLLKTDVSQFLLFLPKQKYFWTGSAWIRIRIYLASWMRIYEIRH